MATRSTVGMIADNTAPNTSRTSTKAVSSIDPVSVTSKIDEIPIIGTESKAVSINTTPDTKLISEIASVNMTNSTKKTLPKIVSIDNSSPYKTISGMTTIFNHYPNSHLQSAILNDKKSSNTKMVTNSLLKPILSHATSTMMISASQTIETKITERNFKKSDLQLAQKIRQQQKDDKLKMEPNYIRLRASSTSPIITYSQSAPKTRLDQWKLGMNQQQQQQQQQSINQNWINNKNNSNNDSDNHNNINNNNNRILPSSFFSISLFSLIFLLRMLSL
ncbi:hypothetical protein LOAG_13645 [Loa loa]|uniref:Myb domain-containing protein n=1 Tax=Loa loa TaxID=7209 RepID=A0A1I7VHC8_LOALO|nr:hypothetical protein LOAG_13645 [Loa loa]EFO14870.1 hypothetical protein LOAG_13645 [Loa loa]